MVMLTSISDTLFKYSKLKNYSLKSSNNLIFNAINTYIFIKSYHLKSLMSHKHSLTFPKFNPCKQYILRV